MWTFLTHFFLRFDVANFFLLSFDGTQMPGNLVTFTILLALFTNLSLLTWLLFSLDRKTTTNVFISFPLIENLSEEKLKYSLIHTTHL
jgi:hypothetical protein